MAWSKKNAVFLLAAIFFLLCGCAGRQRPYIDFSRPEIDSTVGVKVTHDNTYIRIAIAEPLPRLGMVGYYRLLAEHLGVQSGRTPELIQRQSNEEVIVLLANGGADIAIFSAGGYLSYRQAVPVVPLVLPSGNTGIYRNSHVIVNKDSDIADVAGLKGKSFAFSDPRSLAGRLYMVRNLKDRGFNPDQFFSNYVYTYSYVKSLQATADGVVSGALLDSGFYEYAREYYPQLLAKIKIIDTSPAFPAGPVVVRQDMPLERRELFQSIFLNMHRNQDMKLILEKLYIRRFVDIPPGVWDDARGMLPGNGG